MGAISINRLTNANIYINGNSLLGKAEEITLPSITYKMAEHKALGMIGTMEFFAGIEKMEAKVKWNSFYTDVMKQAGDPFTNVQMQVRSSVEQYTSNGRTAQVPAICYMSAAYKSFPMGSFKQHDNVELESNLSVYYCKLEIDGQVVIEIDVMANIYKVDGVDLFAQYRANIGG